MYRRIEHIAEQFTNGFKVGCGRQLVETDEQRSKGTECVNHRMQQAFVKAFRHVIKKICKCSQSVNALQNEALALPGMFLKPHGNAVFAASVLCVIEQQVCRIIKSFIKRKFAVAYAYAERQGRHGEWLFAGFFSAFAALIASIYVLNDF